MVVDISSVTSSIRGLRHSLSDGTVGKALANQEPFLIFRHLKRSFNHQETYVLHVEAHNFVHVTLNRDAGVPLSRLRRQDVPVDLILHHIPHFLRLREHVFSLVEEVVL